MNAFKTAAPYHRLGMVQSYTPTPAEQRELAEIQAYLAEHAKSDFRHMPEKTVANVMNKASPNVRAHMKGSQAVVERFRDTNGREALFEPKRYVEDLPVPKETLRIMDRADTEATIHGLNERMNTASQSAAIAPSDAPPSIAETMSAAFDLHTPQE